MRREPAVTVHRPLQKQECLVCEAFYYWLRILADLNLLPSQAMHHTHVQRLQLLVHDCLSKHLYASAIFYADKLVSLSGAPADLFTLAQVSEPSH